MTLRIIGAGLAGLLAGNMLKQHQPQILEQQSELPNNHSAVLRFRSSIVGDTLSIPFNKVSMIKASVPWRNPVADALAYSFKNTGSYRSDRSITQGLVTADRWIAPSDLIPRMAAGLNIEYNKSYRVNADFFDAPPIISTIPMPTLMRLLDYPGAPNIEFNSSTALNVRFKVRRCDAYASLLFPADDVMISRISITGDELIAEAPNAGEKDYAQVYEQLLKLVTREVGIRLEFIHSLSYHVALYAKIIPIEEDVRRDFMYWATDRFNIFSLGRYATWRPGLLLDDLVKDIRLIEGWLDRKNRYAAAKHR